MPLVELWRTREPVRLTIWPDAKLSRGLDSFKPKHPDYSKMTSSLLRPFTPQIDEASLLSGSVLLSSVSGVDRLHQLLPEWRRLRLLASNMPNLLDTIHQVKNQEVLAVIGQGSYQNLAAHRALALSLANSDAVSEGALASRLQDQVRTSSHYKIAQGINHDGFVLEEKSGRLTTLQLTERTLKQNAKKWQAMAQRRPGDGDGTESEVPLGFGAGALLMSSDSVSDKWIASADFRCGTSILDFSVINSLLERLLGWLQSFKGPALLNPMCIVLSVPSLSVAARLEHDILRVLNPVSSPKIVFPDLAFGWHPLLSLLGIFIQPSLPALFLDTGSFPDVFAAVIWS